MSELTRHTITDWESRADDLRERADALRAKERELSAALARAHADGAPAEAIETVTAERRAVRDELSDVEAALPLLRHQIARAREAAAEREAAELQRTLKKRLGGLVSEHGRRLARLEAAFESFRREVEALNGAWRTQQSFLVERVALCRRFPSV